MRKKFYMMLCTNVLTTYEVVGSMAHKIFTPNHEQGFADAQMQMVHTTISRGAAH